ncbi:MAG: hypothetical protein GWN16_11150 [Calditrichae bacterium]|nr:hypothetical protein [Calditrichia bacterium]
MKEYFWYEFDRAETILEAGEKATALYIEKILHLQELLQDQFNDTKNVRLTSKAG